MRNVVAKNSQQFQALGCALLDLNVMIKPQSRTVLWLLLLPGKLLTDQSLFLSLTHGCCDIKRSVILIGDIIHSPLSTRTRLCLQLKATANFTAVQNRKGSDNKGFTVVSEQALSLTRVETV